MEPLAKLKPKQLKSRIDWAAAWHLFMAGATLEEVSVMLGIAYTTVVNHSAANHWSSRRIQALTVAREAIKTDLKARIEKSRATHTHKMLDQLESTMEHIEDMEIGTKECPVERKLQALDRQDIIARRVLGLDKPETDDPLKAGFMLLASLGRSLVNESEAILDAEIVQQAKLTDQESTETTETQGGDEGQNDPIPHSNHSDASIPPFLPILRAANGESNANETHTFHPFAPETTQIGETGITQVPTPLPDKIIFPE